MADPVTRVPWFESSDVTIWNAWVKTDAMPESVQDRFSSKWEYVYHLTRKPSYQFDLDAVREPYSESSRASTPKKKWLDIQYADREDPGFGKNSLMLKRWVPDGPGKNPGDVWSIPSDKTSYAHFAVFPEELIRRPILATVPEGGVVLDPFFGSGTTGVMARRLGRRAWGIELNADYCRLAAGRFTQGVLPLEAS